MLHLYRHRVNTLEALEQTPPTQGIEFDLRSDGSRVIVTHDPFTDGVPIEAFFRFIGKRPCIFNVKCEGIEQRVLDVAAAYGIQNFFFLDLSVPAAVKLWRQGETRIAVRWSELEPIEGVMAWQGRAQWVWVDCFDNFPGTAADWERVSAAFHVCLVSPELQGHGTDRIVSARAFLEGRTYDAVCTKRPDLWTSA